jgi:hypothetical protein
MSTKSLIEMQEQVDRANREQIIALLARVVGWEVNINTTAQILRKRDAQGLIDAILITEGDGALGRARKFLHGLAEQAGARGGF